MMFVEVLYFRCKSTAGRRNNNHRAGTLEDGAERGIAAVPKHNVERLYDP